MDHGQTYLGRQVDRGLFHGLRAGLDRAGGGQIIQHAASVGHGNDRYKRRIKQDRDNYAGRAMRTAHDWYNILVASQVKPRIALQWSDVFADVVKPTSFSLGDAEISSFLGQILHESAGLTQFGENLSYSAERLTQVWPSRFPTLESAQPYARNPEALANKVYGGRMGNTTHGDGWKYRGRGPIQLTGRVNYAFVGDLIGQDLDVMPELIEQPRYALEAAIAWWEGFIPDDMIGDVERVTRRVNGGLIGLADRERLTELAKGALA